ncbi:MAG: GtrA family protein [Proteobacteria bacterium]|nr:GtrA family protein [Pseudomonadota bacterium]
MTLIKHASKYTLVGILEWVVDYTVALALRTWLMPIEPANIIGRMAGAGLGFWINGTHTFASDSSGIGRRQFARYVVMWIGTTILDTWLLRIIDHQSGLAGVAIGKPFVDFLSGTIGFFLSRHWIYKHKAPRDAAIGSVDESA